MSAATHRHAVQFYERDQFLVDTVVDYLAGGLHGGASAVAIATPAHRDAFARGLAASGLDVDALRLSGRLALLDAETTLALLMTDGAPDPKRFETIVGAALDRPGIVYAYGEMVDLLWRAGAPQAALQLETLWNKLAETRRFLLLCAYQAPPDRAAICAVHDHTLPDEDRARALERELAKRVEVEAMLREALAREREVREGAERSVRFNEMFAAMLGHDLRNPLNTIVVGSSYLERALDGERHRSVASRIVSSADRMAKMIDQLLDFTRIRIGGGLALERKPVDLGDVCTRVRDELEAAHRCRIALAFDGDSTGTWDADRLLQVFSNLAGNAVTHGDATCAVRVDGTEPEVVVATVHNRTVIAPDVLPVVFDPFRSGRKAHGTQGLGLGLYISRQIVLAHGGAIAAVSNDDDGTMMRVTLPRHAEAGKLAV